MSISTTNTSQLPASGKPTLAPRLVRHSWTNDELNLIAYRRSHHWTFHRIRKTHFPSQTERSVVRAYGRVPVEEREYRASVGAALAITSRDASRSEDHRHSDPVPGPSHHSRLASQPDGNTEIPRLRTLRHKRDKRPVSPIEKTANRYNLRPNRRKTFPRSTPRYLVDRFHFPHFFESYKNSLKAHGAPDRDYAPPSHSPTPDPSDRSPSVVSSQLSEASSLELFGLEVRSLGSSHRSPSIAPSQTSDVSSPEFFSSEERLVSP